MDALRETRKESENDRARALGQGMTSIAVRPADSPCSALLPHHYATPNCNGQVSSPFTRRSTSAEISVCAAGLAISSASTVLRSGMASM